jgi:lysophospholipase L1-like esterase
VHEVKKGRVNHPIIVRRLLAALSLALSTLPLPLAHAVDAPPAAPAAPVSLTPAAVPPAVAFARPSAAEIAAATDALNKFLAQDPATRAIAAKYPDLLAVRPPRAVNPSLTPALANAHRAKHAANVALAQKGDIDVLFMGDSITDSWRGTGKEVFEKYYGTMKVANFGIGGDTIQGVLYRLRDGEGQGFQPKAIMLMIGTNNAGALSSAEIAEGVGAIVLDMRTRFPAAKILLLAIFPRADPGSALRNTVNGANPIIAKLHDGKNVFYLDIGAKFLAADGTIPFDIMQDKLHPTAKGYEIWAEAVKEPLAELLK